VLLFATLILRLIWRWSNPVPSAPASHKPFERRAARVVHGLLYLLLFALMLSGYLISTADGRGLEVFDWFSVPAPSAAWIGRRTSPARCISIWPGR
jgi:cytochrome b561